MKDENLKLHRLVESIGDVEETGETFSENALLKARAVRSYFPDDVIIAEDSGLVISSLNGFPGVKTARFAAGTDNDRAQLVLNKLNGTPLSEREASFISAIALLFPTGEEVVTHGELKGWIEDAPIKGNGYSDVFLLCNGKLLVEQEQEVLDHRKQALFAAKLRLVEWLNKS